MRHDRRKGYWTIDAALFGGFLLAMWLDLTGVVLHQWLGVALAGLAAIHLAVHWDWAVAVTRRLFGRSGGRARLAYAVDAAVAAGFLAIGLTGLVVSTWLDFPAASVAAWRNAHVLAAVATLALIVAKIGLHWRWIVGVARRLFSPAPAPAAVRPTTAPRPATATLSRRDFLRLMGGVSAVALLAGARVLGGSQVSATAETSSASAQAASAAASNSAATGSSNGAAVSSGSSSCVVRCNRRCSYPGHCRRYADSNGNGRCDLGECLS